MKYALTFLGLIASTTAFASSNPATDTTTTTSTTDPCKNVIQTIMKPLAKDPWSKKFCAAKFPSDTVSSREVDSVEVEMELEKRGTPLWTQMGLDEKEVLETFCKCNFGRGSGGTRGSPGRKYRGRIKRWVVEEDE